MKLTRDFRGKTNDFSAGDSMKKAVKLEPIKKSGKERHALYSDLDEDDELDGLIAKRESILDYFDDGEDD